MNFVSTFLAIYALFSSVAFAADTPSPQTPAVQSSPAVKPTADTSQKPELPHGVIESKLISDAPLPSDFVMGKKDAPVVMVEYASLSCPHCAHFSASVMPDIQKKYIDTGKVRYVLRQFPLNEPAMHGAMLVTCMGEQDSEKYYMFSKVLFDSQSKWAFDGGWQSALETIAAVGGVSKEQFNSCINNTERESTILKSKMAAMNELKVPHTPYLFIAGEAYNDPMTVEAVSKFIDAKLAKK